MPAEEVRAARRARAELDPGHPAAEPDQGVDDLAPHEGASLLLGLALEPGEAVDLVRRGRAVEVRDVHLELGARARRELASDHLATAAAHVGHVGHRRLAGVRDGPDRRSIHVLPGDVERGLVLDDRVGPNGLEAEDADGEAAQVRRIALLDGAVARCGARPAVEGVRDHARHERIGLDREVIGRAVRREDAGVALDRCRAAARAGADEADLVDDHGAALQGGADPVRAGAEDEHQQGSGDPRQLAPIEATQDQVADRADEEDVADDHDEEQLGGGNLERRQVAERVAHRVLGLLGDRGTPPKNCSSSTLEGRRRAHRRGAPSQPR